NCGRMNRLSSFFVKLRANRESRITKNASKYCHPAMPIHSFANWRRRSKPKDESASRSELITSKVVISRQAAEVDAIGRATRTKQKEPGTAPSACPKRSTSTYLPQGRSFRHDAGTILYTPPPPMSVTYSSPSLSSPKELICIPVCRSDV